MRAWLRLKPRTGWRSPRWDTTGILPWLGRADLGRVGNGCCVELGYCGTLGVFSAPFSVSLSPLMLIGSKIKQVRMRLKVWMESHVAQVGRQFLAWGNMWVVIPPFVTTCSLGDPESPSQIPLWFPSLCVWESVPQQPLLMVSVKPQSGQFPVSLIKSYSRVWAEFENSFLPVHPLIVLSLIQMLPVRSTLFPWGLSITFVSLSREQRLPAHTFTNRRASTTDYLCSYLSVLKSFTALCIILRN